MTTIDVILKHTYQIVERKLFTCKTDFVRLITALLKTSSLLRRCHKIFLKHKVYEKIVRIYSIVRYLRSYEGLTDEHRDIIYLSGVEPLEMNMLRPLNILKMIQEYEKRCFVVYQQLHWDPRCPPKLRNYVQSFKLNREAFIRHIMLHCFEKEYMALAHDLTFMFWYHFGWTDEIMAFENVMRITVDVSHIALMYLDTFPKDTFIMLLFAIVQFCWWVAKKLMRDKQAIRCILLKTLLSMSHIVNKTHYREMYNALLKRIQDLDPYLQRKEYFYKLRSWINMYFKECESLIPQINKDR